MFSMEGSKGSQIDFWTSPYLSAMPQPWRRSEIIEISDSDESDNSDTESLSSRSSRQLTSQRTKISSFRQHTAPVSTTVAQHTSPSQSVDRATSSSLQPYGLSSATVVSSSWSGTPIKGKGKAKEITSVTNTQACESGNSQQSAYCLPFADDRCTFA